MIASTSRILSRSDLRAAGLTPAAITRAVRSSLVIRGRNGHYLPGDTPEDVVRAVRLGGLLACVSALAHYSVFVRSADVLHVHLSAHASRLRAAVGPVRRHWCKLVSPVPRDAVCVDVIDALRQAVRCQSPRDVVATVDSALHQGLIDVEDLAVVFAGSGRRSVLRRLVDGRAESGTETLVRLMLRGWGVTVELQVRIDGVGRVDLLVDGWLIVECDSRAHHADWAAQLRDRRRDQQAAAQGYTTYRPVAEDILYRPELVVEALRGLLRRGRR